MDKRLKNKRINEVAYLYTFSHVPTRANHSVFDSTGTSGPGEPTVPAVPAVPAVPGEPDRINEAAAQSLAEVRGPQ